MNLYNYTFFNSVDWKQVVVMVIAEDQQTAEDHLRKTEYVHKEHRYDGTIEDSLELLSVDVLKIPATIKAEE